MCHQKLSANITKYEGNMLNMGKLWETVQEMKNEK